MASRDEFDDFFDDDDGAPVIDTRADGRLYRVRLGRLSPNLVNPRNDFGTEDDLIDFGKSLGRRQNHACPVVSRAAYLKLWPDHADQIGDVDYVLVSGERRYRAAAIVGLPALDCVANDDFAADRKTFMEAVVSENVDRQNFDPIEEAYAVQALVAEFGSNRAVAQHFERVDGWVTQRVLLTHLAREVQDLVRKKTIPLDAARSLGKLTRDNDWDAAQQLAWWNKEQGARKAAADERKARRSFTAVKQGRPDERGSMSSSSSSTASPSETAAPPPRAAGPVHPQPESLTAVKSTRTAQAERPEEQELAQREAVEVPAARVKQPADVPQQTPAEAQPRREERRSARTVPDWPFNDVQAMKRIILENMTVENRKSLAKMLYFTDGE